MSSSTMSSSTMSSSRSTSEPAPDKPAPDKPADKPAKAELMRQLRGRLERLEKTVGSRKQLRISSGCESLDCLLPGGGFAPGSLVEWLAAVPGGGVSCLAFAAARQLQENELQRGRIQGMVIVVDRPGMFYPPAAAAWGIDLERMIVVHPRNDMDEFWALDQILRCRHVALLLAWPQRLDSFTFRRLQLAAESGGGLGFLIRDAAARGEPSWADIRLLVSPRGNTTVDQTQLNKNNSRVPRAHAADISPAETRSTDSIPADSIPADSIPEKVSSTGTTAPVSTPVRRQTGRRSSPVSVDSAQGWQLRLEILRCRGCLNGRQLELQIDSRTGAIHETHSGNLASELAYPASDQHSARA